MYRTSSRSKIADISGPLIAVAGENEGMSAVRASRAGINSMYYPARLVYLY